MILAPFIKYTAAGLAVVAVPIIAAEAEPFSWSALGTGLAVAFIAFMQIYQSWQIKREAAKAAAAEESARLTRLAVAEKLASVESKVDGLSDKRDEATRKSSFAEGEKAESEKATILELHKQAAFAEGKAQQAAVPTPVTVENEPQKPVPTKVSP